MKHVEAGASSPPQSVASGVVAAAPTFTGQSMQFSASGLLEYAHLSTRLMADAKSSCQQLGTIAWLARTTTMPDLKVEDLPKVDADATNRLQQADRRYQPDLVVAA